MENTQGPFRVYLDGIFDLFHTGHSNLLKKARDKAETYSNGRDVHLLVGVCNDGVENYKRKTIMDYEERCAALRAHELVQEVIDNCPIRLDAQFLEDNEIDLVVRGDDFPEDKKRYFYGAAINSGRYAEVPYTQGVSTSQLIREAKLKGKFSIPMDQTLLSVVELVERIRQRSWKELKVARPAEKAQKT